MIVSEMQEALADGEDAPSTLDDVIGESWPRRVGRVLWNFFKYRAQASSATSVSGALLI